MDDKKKFLRLDYLNNSTDNSIKKYIIKREITTINSDKAVKQILYIMVNFFSLLIATYTLFKILIWIFKQTLESNVFLYFFIIIFIIWFINFMGTHKNVIESKVFF